MTNTPSHTPIDAIAKSDAQERVAHDATRDVGHAEDEVASKADGGQRKRTPNSSYQNYLFGSSGSSETPAWSDSVKGRAIIRLVSRGIVGAAFFTAGSRIAKNQLEGYARISDGVGPDVWKWDKSKPLHWIARGFDVTFGKVIEGVVKFGARGTHGVMGAEAEAAKIAREALTFRSTRLYDIGNVLVDGKVQKALDAGRTYGAEVVGITFDFAMASIGDAGTRNLIQALDPNVKKSWLLNDRGEAAERSEKKHIDWGKWAKSTAKTTWRVFSKNQGEDWAAAIPYVFQMKFQRQFLNNIAGNKFEGHKIAFDNNWNGGAFKLDKAGKIIGDYQLAGAIDLHARFVGYNWYTLMYREGYDTIANAFSEWKEKGFPLAPHLPKDINPITAVVDGIGSSLRYVAKSFIKANLYMNPAVIPFWIMRVPQSKWRGGMIQPHATDDRLGIVEMSSGAKNARSLPPLDQGTHLYEPLNNIAPEHLVVRQSRDSAFINGPRLADRNIHNPISPKGVYHDDNYKHYEEGFGTTFSKILNYPGKVSYYLGTKATKFGDKFLPKTGPIADFLHNYETNPVKFAPEREKFMREFVDASMAYTPYMFAKAEFGLRVDDSKGDGKAGTMDKAIYGFLDNLASFNIKGLDRSIKNIAYLSTHFEHEITGREAGDVIETKISKVVPPKQPATTVQANTLMRHDPVVLARAERDVAANDATNDKRWAQMVVGSDYNAARIHPASSTRH